MFQSGSSIALLAFLLINFFQLFLHREAPDCSIAEYIVWINTNIIYLTWISGIFSRHWSSGSLEQIVTFTSNIKGFITRIIVGAWVRQGIPLILLATALFYLLAPDSSTIIDTIIFGVSLTYSTLILSFIGVSCGSLSICSDPITSIVIAVPISLPGVITAISLLKWSVSSPSTLIVLLIGNAITVAFSPLLMEIVLRETLENL